MPKVSIIILTYNSSTFIKDLIKSLISLKENAEILVVDNASADDTVEIAKKFIDKGIKVFETGKNLGVSKGINYGAKKANGNYLLFINPDTVFENGSLQDLVNVFESHEKAGIVGGKMINKDGDPEKSAGNFFNLKETVLLVLGLDEALGVRFSPDKLSKVDFVSGGFMMVRSNLFKRLNGFDEKFFMYVEDMELSYRAKKLGFEAYFTPEAVISHVGQGSSNRGFAVINIYKGILYFYSKHKSRFEFRLIKFLLILKARAIYMLGVITKNSYYIDTYKKALAEIYKI